MTALRHSGVYVDDMERMIGFYIGTFNMEIASRATEKGKYIETVLDGPEGTELDVCKMTFPGGGMVELIHANIGEDKNLSRNNLYDKGMHHIAITVDSADETYDRLSEAGCACLSEPTLNSDSSAKVFFARDPEGNFLELVELMRD